MCLHFIVVDSGYLKFHFLYSSSWYSIASSDETQQTLLSIFIQVFYHIPEISTNNESHLKQVKLWANYIDRNNIAMISSLSDFVTRLNETAQLVSISLYFINYWRLLNMFVVQVLHDVLILFMVSIILTHALQFVQFYIWTSTDQHFNFHWL